MRVLLCSNFHYRRGGDCTYLLALKALLEKHGHETAVFSMRHPQNLPSPQEEYFVDHLDYAELNAAKNPANALKVLGRSIWSAQARRKIGRLVADWKPDVAHLQNVHAYLTPSILGPLKAAGVPAYWSLHDFKLLCPESHFLSGGDICEECRGGRYWKCAAKRCKKSSLAASAVAALEAYAHRLGGVAGRVAGYLAPSQFVKEKFAEYGHSAGRIHVMPHFAVGEAPAATRAGGYGIYAGTLMPYKGVGTLLRALAKARRHPFRVLGGGEGLEEYRREAARLGLEQVEFRGFLTGAEWEAEMSGAEYAVVPSECYETFSYAAQEPLARGIPVIASDLGALPELVLEGETGLLFPAGNAEALAERIDRLRGDARLGKELGEGARRHVAARCDAEAYMGRLLEIYEGGAKGEKAGGL